MLKTGAKFFLFLAAVFTICKCIDPYTPKLEGYEAMLVVEGLITDEDASYTVKLSNTIQNQDLTATPVSDATVYITDDENTITNLKNSGNGKYITNNLEFHGIIGKTYVLHVLTNDDTEYESEPCTMESVPEIDSIYFEKEQELVNNGTEVNEGIRIYLNSKGGDNSKYFRWDFEETWKFKVPTPTRSIYIDEKKILMIPDPKEYCWKSNKSDDILIRMIHSDISDFIEKMPLTFIASDKSDRLMLHYSILVRQYSISHKEYEFWNNLTKVNENGGDIFAAQPYPVVSNIHNISNHEKPVLGYFQVSAVKQRRLEIPFSDIVKLDLPFYHYQCIRIEDSPFILPWVKWNPPLTWDDIYNMYTTSGYSFVEPKYIPGTLTLDRLVFSKPECSDCELTGTRTKPVFRIDIK